jgi:ribosomal-protein-alanine N-acetyltransferase
VTLRIEPLPGGAAGPLSRLHLACFPEDPWDAAAITKIMGMVGFFGRIAWEDKTPSGFALALGLGEECEILALGVVSERRRAGIGSALVDSICCEAQQRGADRVLLEVAVDNVAARALYAARGFIQVGCRRCYYRQNDRLVDALVLRLALAKAAPST